MQEKKRIPLKRLHRLRNARKQAAETDDLTPMMKAIKAVHSVTSTGSTQPEDLERQRAAQELFARLVTPNLLINTTPITVNNVSAEWVRMNQGPPPCGAILPWRRLHLRPVGLCPRAGQQTGAFHRVRCTQL